MKTLTISLSGAKPQVHEEEDFFKIEHQGVTLRAECPNHHQVIVELEFSRKDPQVKALAKTLQEGEPVEIKGQWQEGSAYLQRQARNAQNALAQNPTTRILSAIRDVLATAVLAAQRQVRRQKAKKSQSAAKSSGRKGAEPTSRRQVYYYQSGVENFGIGSNVQISFKKFGNSRILIRWLKAEGVMEDAQKDLKVNEGFDIGEDVKPEKMASHIKKILATAQKHLKKNPKSILLDDTVKILQHYLKYYSDAENFLSYSGDSITDRNSERKHTMQRFNISLSIKRRAPRPGAEPSDSQRLNTYRSKEGNIAEASNVKLIVKLRQGAHITINWRAAKGVMEDAQKELKVNEGFALGDNPDRKTVIAYLEQIRKIAKKHLKKNPSSILLDTTIRALNHYIDTFYDEDFYPDYYFNEDEPVPRRRRGGPAARRA